MMKIILFTLSFFLFNSIFADDIPIKVKEEIKINLLKPKFPKDQISFYFVFNNFLITGVKESYQDLLKKHTDWETVDTSDLGSLGIKEGEVIQYIDFNTGEKKEYTFKSKTHLALIENGFYKPDRPSSIPNRTFYILLNDSKESAEHPGTKNGDDITGFAYRGTDLRLKATKPISPSYTKVSENEVIIKNILGSYHEAMEKVRNGSLYVISEASLATFEKMEMYKFEGTHPNENRGVGLVMKIGSNNFTNLAGYWSDTDYSPSMGAFKYLDLFEEYDFAILLKDSGMHSCYSLHLYKGDSSTVYKMDCDSGGC